MCSLQLGRRASRRKLNRFLNRALSDGYPCVPAVPFAGELVVEPTQESQELLMKRFLWWHSPTTLPCRVSSAAKAWSSPCVCRSCVIVPQGSFLMGSPGISRSWSCSWKIWVDVFVCVISLLCKPHIDNVFAYRILRSLGNHGFYPELFSSSNRVRIYDLSKRNPRFELLPAAWPEKLHPDKATPRSL